MRLLLKESVILLQVYYNVHSSNVTKGQVGPRADQLGYIKKMCKLYVYI